MKESGAASLQNQGKPGFGKSEWMSTALNKRARSLINRFFTRTYPTTLQLLVEWASNLGAAGPLAYSASHRPGWDPSS